MARLGRAVAFHSTVAALVIFFLSQTTALMAEVTYTVVDEKISDTPIKTQIVQHIVVSGVPTAAELEAEIRNRYHAATARRGFRYYNPATNISIYVYGTEQQATRRKSDENRTCAQR